MEKAGCGSRKKIKQLLKSRQIKIDGQVETRSSRIVDSRLQEILVGERKIELEPAVYYLLHKPAGYVSAVRDEKFPTVLDLLESTDRREGIYPVGRLDRDTEGLLLLTNNGSLGFRMLHPQHHVGKSYYVEVNGFLGEHAPEFFQKGVEFLDGTICQPAWLKILSASESMSRAEIELSEGKFHQIKKMFLAYGVKVTYLKRLSFGGFVLPDDLEKGAYRPLNQAEEELLNTYLD